MDGQSTPAEANEETTRVETALRAERLRLYQAILWTTPAAQGLVAMLLVAVLWGTIEPTALFGWLACLALAVGARLGVALRDRAAAGTPAAASPSALWRVRLLVAFSGAAWGLAGVWLFPAQDLQAQTFLAFVLAGMAAGSLTVTAFDLAAALAFATLALAPLVVRLLAAGGQTSAAMAAMVVLFVAFLALAGMRAQRNLRDTGYQDRIVEALVIGIQRYFAKNPPLARQRQL